VIALVASELSTPVGEVEAMTIPKALDYYAAAVRLLQARAGKPQE